MAEQKPAAFGAVGTPGTGTTMVGQQTGGGAVIRFVVSTLLVLIERDFMVEIGDETTALTTGVGKRTFRMPYAATLVSVRANVRTAPTGSTLIVDINENGTTILSTKLSINAGAKTSVGATSAAVISDTALADDAEITIDVDQIGSTISGAGLKVTFTWRRN